MIFMLDNYDSFTYNLVQYLGQLGQDIQVCRNDRITVDEIRAMNPEKIVISPGPCSPNEAGISVELIRSLHKDIPILGVCLGHQSIGAAFGGNIIHAARLMHGKISRITHDNTGIFTDMPNPFQAVRYHSLAIERSSLPDCLTITAESEDGEIMGIRHKDYQVEGVQFHPESILTEQGIQILRNFVESTDSAELTGVRR